MPILTIFGPQTTLGLVRLYSARTAKRVSAALQESRTNQRIVPMFSPQDVRSTQKLFGH